jgi:hypothetical protein
VITITRRHHRRPVTRVTLRRPAGANTVWIRFAHRRRGRYVVRVHAAGGSAASARLRWRRR